MLPATARTLRRRHRSLEAEAAYALYEYERRRYGRRGKGIITEEFVRRQLQRFEYRSVISSKTENLRLRRFWPDVELNDWNCVVVTSKENQSLAHLRTTWLSKFPEMVVTLMETHRRLQERDDANDNNNVAIINEERVYSIFITASSPLQ
jgi:hypothetical protein